MALQKIEEILKEGVKDWYIVITENEIQTDEILIYEKEWKYL